MVLFLFVIMLLGAERLRVGSSAALAAAGVPIVLGVILLVVAVYALLFRSPAVRDCQHSDAGFGGLQAMAELLFNAYLLPFEITSILLLVAMIGAIVLTRRKRQPRSDPPGIDGHRPGKRRRMVSG